MSFKQKNRHPAALGTNPYIDEVGNYFFRFLYNLECVHNGHYVLNHIPTLLRSSSAPLMNLCEQPKLE
jgi:hypothetical protein